MYIERDRYNIYIERERKRERKKEREREREYCDQRTHFLSIS